MRWAYTIGSSIALVTIGAIGSPCIWSADYLPQQMQQQSPQMVQQNNNYYKGRGALTAMTRADRLSFADYQADIRAYAEANQRIQSGTQPHLGPFQKIAQSHQQIRQTSAKNREYVVQWFCYIKGNGAAVWDHRP